MRLAVLGLKRTKRPSRGPACGNVTRRSNFGEPLYGIAAMAGAHINADLVTEETRDAVRDYRDAFTADVFTGAAEARLCEQVAGDRRHGL